MPDPNADHTNMSDIARQLRALPVPDPPPWLHTRVVTALFAEQQRQREHRRRRLFALGIVLQCLVFAANERMSR